MRHSSYRNRPERGSLIADIKFNVFSLRAADDYSTAVAVFMQLRKVADHPLLERSLYNDENLRKMATDYIKVNHFDRSLKLCH